MKKTPGRTIKVLCNNGRPMRVYASFKRAETDCELLRDANGDALSFELLDIPFVECSDDVPDA